MGLHLTHRSRPDDETVIPCSESKGQPKRTRKLSHRLLYSSLIVLALEVVANAAIGAPPEIKVGILHSQTGSMAASEKPLIDAALMAIDEINEMGGVLGHRIIPIIEDGASAPGTFAEKAEKLIVEDQVVSIFGCWTSACRKAVIPVLEKHQHLLWYPLQSEGNEASPYVVYTGSTPNQQLLPALDWCFGRFATKFALVGSDYIFPRTANGFLRNEIEARGGQTLSEAYRPLGDTDFATIVKEIARLRPDFILNTVNGDSNKAFFRALYDADLDIPVMSFSVAEPEVEQIGVELLQGHFASWTYFQSIPLSSNRRFVAEYQRRFGADRVTSDPIHAAYSQMWIFAKATESVGKFDATATRQGARGLIVKTPGALIRIDSENRHIWKVARIGQVVSSGQFRVLWSSSEPLPPNPYLIQQLERRAQLNWLRMHEHVTEMIDMEALRPASDQRRHVLKGLADVCGMLSIVNAKIHAATSFGHPVQIHALQETLASLDKLTAIVDALNALLTAQQREHWLQFQLAYDDLADTMTIVTRTY